MTDITEMTDITAVPSPPGWKRIPATLSTTLGAMPAAWARACRAHRLAEDQLFASDATLRARGTTRQAVSDHILRILTEAD